jgi:hypothetical protein
MARQPNTVLEKTLEAGRSLVVAGVLLTLISGLMMTTESTVVFGYILSVISVAMFLYGLVTVHAGTTEALIRARLVDMRSEGSPRDGAIPSPR